MNVLNKFSTVYVSLDGNVSASHHLDYGYAEDELSLLEEDVNVFYACICLREECEDVIYTLQKE